MEKSQEPTDSDNFLGCLVVALFVLIWFIGGFRNTPEEPPAQDTHTPTVSAVSYPDPTTFRIVAESAVKPLQDAGIFDDFTKETGIKLSIDYRGPVDVRNAVSNLGKNNRKTVDAYWPGSLLWLPGLREAQSRFGCEDLRGAGRRSGHR